MAETDTATEGSAMTSTQIPAIRTYQVNSIMDSLPGATKLAPDDHTAVIVVPLEEIAKMNPELASVDPTRIVSFPMVALSSQSMSFNAATAALGNPFTSSDYFIVITAYSTASIGSNISYTTLYANLAIAVLQ